MLGTEHASQLASAFVEGMSQFLRAYLPMLLVMSLLGQTERIGKTLTGWVRQVAVLHIRRLRRASREAESVTLFWFFTVKLKPLPRPRARKKTVEIEASVGSKDGWD